MSGRFFCTKYWEGPGVSYQTLLHSGASYLVKGVTDDVILQELGRHLQLHKVAGEVGPFPQLGEPLQQPLEQRVDDGLTARHQTASEATPERHKREHHPPL